MVVFDFVYFLETDNRRYQVQRYNLASIFASNFAIIFSLKNIYIIFIVIN